MKTWKIEILKWTIGAGSMTKAKKKKTVMGRPKGQGEPQVSITFLVTFDMKRTLFYMAAQEGMTLSSLLKSMAEREIENYNQ